MPNEDAKNTLKLLRKLQESLLELKRLESEIESTPERVETLNQTTNASKKQLEKVEEALKNEKLNNSRLDGEVKSLQEQLSSKHQATLAVKTNDQLWAIQKEITFLEESISDIEMKMIQSMEDTEALEAKLLEAKKTFAADKAKNDKNIAEMENILAKMKKEVVTEQKTYDKLSGEIPAKYAILLKKIQDKLKSTAMAEIIDGSCGACHVRIRPQMSLEVRMGTTIHQCPNCARILFSMQEKQESETKTK